MKLCNKDLFSLLGNLLKVQDTPLLVKSSVVFLIINIINNNSKLNNVVTIYTVYAVGHGQNMTFETKILHKLIDLFK